MPIRTAKEDDRDAVRQIVDAAFVTLVDEIGLSLVPFDYYATCIDRGEVFILEEGTAPVGLVVLIWSAPYGFILDAVAVLPQEQHKGHGRKLVEFAEREARVRRHDKITVLTPVGMTRNRRIYREAGYVEGEMVMNRGNHHVVMTKAFTTVS